MGHNQFSHTQLKLKIHEGLTLRIQLLDLHYYDCASTAVTVFSMHEKLKLTAGRVPTN